MDKNAIKKYAVWARRELISRVAQRAALYDITEKNTGDPAADSVHGQILTSSEKKQRQALIAQIKQKGYQEVMEEVAYTWFNRFSALRFMEVNGYLPSHVRVFTDDDNAFKPQILTEAINLELDGLDMDKVYELKNDNKTDELFKYLVIVQCNALSSILPGMFQKIEDYTELLFPDNLLREGSAVEQMIAMIPEEDWKDQVQIIGWLYQYYNSEKKDDVFAALKKNVKITKENIPAATQLFTPDWIVRYMVENSLGRLWVEGHPNDDLKSQWKYYLDEAEQEPDVQVKLADIRKEYAALKPEDLRCIDPCSGSGHILAYMFDVLVQIYEAQGYTTRDAVRSIVENNIYGLDIDDRAAQLAYFSVMMKGRQYDGRFFKRGVQPHVYAIEESNYVDQHALEYFCKDDAKLTKAMKTIVAEMQDAKEYGSIMTITQQDWSAIYNRFSEIYEDINILRDQALAMLPMVQVAEVLSQKYHIVVTNPPYIGSPNMGIKLQKYINDHYKAGKADIFGAFIERNFMFAKNYVCMITQSTWMFQSRFETLRRSLYSKMLVNMNHLGTRAFDEISGEVVQTAAFCYRQANYIQGYKTLFVKLMDYAGEYEKSSEFSNLQNRVTRDIASFLAIPGAPFVHYISQNATDIFRIGTPLKDILIPKQGTSTGDDETFVRYWHEIEFSVFNRDAISTADAHKSGKKYFPLDKGGEYRKWYGNNDRVIRFDSISYNKLMNMGNHLPSRGYYFRKGLTWSKIASELSVRYSPRGFVFSSVGLKGFPSDDKELYLLGFMNSCVCRYYIQVISPGMSIVSGDIEKLPLLVKEQDKVSNLVQECIELSREDWDSQETSWDFTYHPLLPVYADGLDYAYSLENFFHSMEEKKAEHFYKLKTNEEELNRIFINIYGLQNELTSEVDEKNVTIHKADLQRDIKSLISFAVGCMFGRYNLWHSGLAYAGGEWDESQYDRFHADKDNIIPICDDEYFEDDIVGRFVEFIRIAYGEKTLEENLKFVAQALGGKGQPRDVIRNYFLNDFYVDHLKIYQKRPIYWLFSSGKKGGFKCLIYMHRYQPDTIARIRTDYVHEQQSRYRTAIADLDGRIASGSTSERVKLSKQLKKLQDQSDEIHVYEEKIHHLADQMIKIDLDDGVKKNYAIFNDVLQKI